MFLLTGPSPYSLTVSTVLVCLSLPGLSPTSGLFLSPSPSNPLLHGTQDPLLPHSEQRDK